MSALIIEIENKSPGTVVAYISGSLDSETYGELEQKALSVVSSGVKVFVLDIAKLSYISSMGISALIKIRKAVAEMQGKFMLVNPQPQIRKVFDIIKALPAETIFRNVEEADAYLTRIQQEQEGSGTLPEA